MVEQVRDRVEGGGGVELRGLQLFKGGINFG